MGNKVSLHRIAAGQSPNDTSRARFKGSISRKFRAFMVTMSFTVILALALLPETVGADNAAPHVTAVAVARATIVSGVRISREQLALDEDSSSRNPRLPKPRERPCPEADERPCREIVVDMP